MVEQGNPFGEFVYDIQKEHVLRAEFLEDSSIREQLYTDASRMVRQFGDRVTTTVGKGAGGGLIGFRIETNESHYVTRNIQMEIGGKQAYVTMNEEFTRAPNYGGKWDTISVKALFFDPDLGGGHELLQFKKDKTLWLRKDATHEQLRIAGEFLKSLEENLKDPVNNSWFGEQL